MSDTVTDAWPTVRFGARRYVLGNSVLATLEVSSKPAGGVPVEVSNVIATWQDPDGVEYEEPLTAKTAGAWRSRITPGVPGTWAVRFVTDTPFIRAAEQSIDISPSDFQPDDVEAELVITDDGTAILITDNGEFVGSQDGN